MNEVHFHLLLNHVPVMAVLFGCILLLYGTWLKSNTVITIALFTFMAAAVAAVPVYFTGTEAEDIVKLQANEKTSLIEKHEIAGEMAVYSAAALGLLAYVAHMLRQDKKPSAQLFTLIVVLLGLAVMCVMVWAGWSGGKIEHS